MVRSSFICVLTFASGISGSTCREHTHTTTVLCRYDVKYGSGGFTTYGWQAGCSFVNGSFYDAMKEPTASQFLCDRSHVGLYECLHDFSGDGVCQTSYHRGYHSGYHSGFHSVIPVCHFHCNPCALVVSVPCFHDYSLDSSD